MSQPQQTTTRAAGDTANQPTAEPVDIDDPDDYRYQCPLCEAVYDSEIAARVHITRSDDDTHQNQNGLMPESYIEIIADDDEVIGTVSRQPDEIAVGSFSLDQVPDEYPEHHKHIIKIATQHPYKNYAEIEDLVIKEFDEKGIDVPSYSTIRRVVRDFYHPRELSEQVESLEALTAKQQAIIIARTLLPSEPKAKISDRVGCASSYPAQVYERAPGIIRSIEESGDVSERIKSELSVESKRELTTAGLVDELPIEFDVAVEEVADTDTEEANDNGQQSLWGSPVDNPTGLRGVPTPESVIDTDDDDAHEDAQTKVPAAPQADDSKPELDSLAEADVLRADVADLYQDISFLSDVYQHVGGNNDPDFTQAVITAVADRCESILQRGEA
ncbi:hypothetical protein [Halorubrum vacuolatum]|uniref:Uncharacterized protein n=1 Tax=Halorubrum vacuolatum TaxID=63740 RepID=A0A238W925_HALVU|nr:hypothetical protein [Halorubrum vacuolatum]SNR43086.1 hypothetical protein SAMN06264855_10661 [Halorubrum vacuolatum]